MKRISSSRSNQDVIVLLDSLGCRIPTMKSVCPEQPRQIGPLVTTFPFRAFMFQGANSGDEMILSVRMIGCLLYEDCFQVSTFAFRNSLQKCFSLPSYISSLISQSQLRFVVFYVKIFPVCE